jgi:hypothetical protein
MRCESAVQSLFVGVLRFCQQKLES